MNKKNLKSQNIFKFLILQPESILKSIKAEYFLNKCILKKNPQIINSEMNKFQKVIIIKNN